MDSKNSHIYNIGLALSGGGARGFAHLGAIRALEEAGIRPDIIAGVSAGSVVACLYAAGLSVEQIINLFVDKKFNDFCEFSFSFRRLGGFFSLDKFREFIASAIAPAVNMEDLKMPTYFGVTDFDRGCRAEFHEGEITTRLAASCAIPICFQPVVIDGTAYVDGGVVRNMPAWIIRDKCRKLIGINCSPVLRRRDEGTMTDVALRSYNLMAKANQSEDLAMCDLAIEIPQIAHYKVFNLKEVNKVYIAGYSVMRKALKLSPWIQEIINKKSQ